MTNTFFLNQTRLLMFVAIFGMALAVCECCGGRGNSGRKCSCN